MLIVLIALLIISKDQKIGKRERMAITHDEKHVRGRSQMAFLKNSLETIFPVKPNQNKP